MSLDAESTIPHTLAAIRAGLASGLHSSAQIYIALRDSVVADVGLGDTMASASVPWLSAGKPIAAVAIAQLWERGLFDLDDRVAAHIPEFAAGGKEAITIRHILTHAAGFRALLGDWENQPWEQVIASLCNARLEPGWIVGQTAGYHPTTSWYILGELVRRLDGRAFDAYAREMIFQPLGMTTATFVDPQTQQVRPGASARGPARELAFFHSALLHHGRTPAGGAIVSPQTVEALTARHRVGVYDKTFRHLIDWGLGFICQSNHYGIETLPYSFGPHASARTFGHGGSRSGVGYCDPENALVVVAIFSRTKTEPEHHARMLEINAAIYQDLGLAS